MLRCRIGGSHYVFFLEVDARECRRLHRERLRRRIPLAGGASLRHSTLLYSEQRPAICAVHNEHPAGLADESRGRNDLAVLADIEERRWCRLIGIPQIMMHGLEMPDVLPRVGVDSNDGVCIQIRAGTIAAPVVAGRTAESRVDYFALLIDGEIPAPVIDALTPLPAIGQPACVTRIARLRHGCKAP